MMIMFFAGSLFGRANAAGGVVKLIAAVIAPNIVKHFVACIIWRLSIRIDAFIIMAPFLIRRLDGSKEPFI
jgi:hypothetical protein